MKIYHYDADSKYYLGQSLADPDPVVAEAIAEREKRLAEAGANERAVLDAQRRGDTLTLPYPNAQDPDEIEPMEPAFLFPAHCTTVPAPADIPAGHSAVWLGDAWAVVELPKAPIPTGDGGEVEADFVPEDEWDDSRSDAEYDAWTKKVLQAHLDVIARSCGYRSMDSMVSYADEPAVPKYQAEGRAGRRWRSLFFAAAYQRLEHARAGQVPEPVTAAALIEGLPVFEPET